jgi:hypothetical protein
MNSSLERGLTAGAGEASSVQTDVCTGASSTGVGGSAISTADKKSTYQFRATHQLLGFGNETYYTLLHLAPRVLGGARLCSDGCRCLLHSRFFNFDGGHESTVSLR